MVIKITVFIVYNNLIKRTLTKFHVVATSAGRLFKKHHMDDGHIINKYCEYCKIRMKENENEKGIGILYTSADSEFIFDINNDR